MDEKLIMQTIGKMIEEGKLHFQFEYSKEDRELEMLVSAEYPKDKKGESEIVERYYYVDIK